MKCPHPFASPARQHPRGMAMVGLALLLFFICAIALLSSLYNGRRGDIGADSQFTLNTVRQHCDTYKARNLAQVGFNMTWQWLQQRASAPTNTAAFTPTQVSNSFYGATYADGYDRFTLNQELDGDPGTIRVRILPESDNAITNRKGFCIEAIGEYNGQRQIVRALVRQKTFAYYAYFANRMGSGWFVSGRNRFLGPVHLNALNDAGDAVDTSAQIKILWRNNSKKDDQIFLHPGDDYLETPAAASQFVWQWSNGVASLPQPPGLADFPFVAAAGTPPLTQAPIVPFPNNSTELQNAAAGFTTVPSSDGVTIPIASGKTSGGIFVNGDVTQLRLAASGEGNINQVITLLQTLSGVETRSTVTLDRVNGRTYLLVETRSSGSSPWTTTHSATYTGTTNGVVYVNGNILGAAGAIANSKLDDQNRLIQRYGLTVAAEYSKDVVINGGLVYESLCSSADDAANPTATATDIRSGVFGLVGGHVRIALKDGGGTALTNLSVHGTVLAYSTFDTDNYDTRADGTFTLLGGYIAGRAGLFGTFNSGTGKALSGFAPNRIYDERLPDTPPPYFPLAGNFYQVTSYQWVQQAL